MFTRESVPGSGEVARLGRYELLGEIATGGMATVFLGRMTGAKGFSRLVAIKRLHPHLQSEEDFVAMFLDEARLAARIRHPNVVATLDVENQAALYIVMEYIEGDRLLGLLRHAARTGDRIPVPVVLRIALDTLAGLHAAHELREDDGESLSLVHRDVSPQNILIGVDGVARLTDFGIAKAASRLTVTRDGQLKGKIAYMAPEQTKRVEIDRRVDVFAMGIITWEMLASVKLFTGESDVEVLNQLLFEPIPRLKDKVSGLPAALDAAVMKALDRDPAKRFATAAEFAEALERAAKIVGGASNARTVAAYLHKVAGDKLARDRAKINSGALLGGDAPSGQPLVSRVQLRAPNDSEEVILASNPSRPESDSGPPAAPRTGPRPAADSRPVQAPVVAADVSLLDDDEDLPTQVVHRSPLAMEAEHALANNVQPSRPPPLPRSSATPGRPQESVPPPLPPSQSLPPLPPQRSRIATPPPPPSSSSRVVLPPQSVPPPALTTAVSAPPPRARVATPLLPLSSGSLAPPSATETAPLPTASARPTSAVAPRSTARATSAAAGKSGAHKGLWLVGLTAMLLGGGAIAWRFTLGRPAHTASAPETAAPALRELTSPVAPTPVATPAAVTAPPAPSAPAAPTAQETPVAPPAPSAPSAPAEAVAAPVEPPAPVAAPVAAPTPQAPEAPRPAAVETAPAAPVEAPPTRANTEPPRRAPPRVHSGGGRPHGGAASGAPAGQHGELPSDFNTNPYQR